MYKVLRGSTQVYELVPCADGLGSLFRVPTLNAEGGLITAQRGFCMTAEIFDFWFQSGS